MKISQLILWLFVMAVGVEMGAGLYETILVVPLWANGGADSVLAYFQQNVANPQFALNAGPRFWMVVTPSVGLLAIATFVTSFWTSQPHRKWRLIGSSLAIFVVGFTFAWFVPNIMRILNDPQSVPAAELAATAKMWVTLNWGRVVFGFSAWICALRAFRIPQD